MAYSMSTMLLETGSKICNFAVASFTQQSKGEKNTRRIGKTRGKVKEKENNIRRKNNKMEKKLTGENSETNNIRCEEGKKYETKKRTDRLLVIIISILVIWMRHGNSCIHIFDNYVQRA